jgi:hypothetical protein
VPGSAKRARNEAACHAAPAPFLQNDLGAADAASDPFVFTRRRAASPTGGQKPEVASKAAGGKVPAAGSRAWSDGKKRFVKYFHECIAIQDAEGLVPPRYQQQELFDLYFKLPGASEEGTAYAVGWKPAGKLLAGGLGLLY